MTRNWCREIFYGKQFLHILLSLLGGILPACVGSPQHTTQKLCLALLSFTFDFQGGDFPTFFFFPSLWFLSSVSIFSDMVALLFFFYYFFNFSKDKKTPLDEEKGAGFYFVLSTQPHHQQKIHTIIILQLILFLLIHPLFPIFFFRFLLGGKIISLEKFWGDLSVAWQELQGTWGEILIFFFFLKGLECQEKGNGFRWMGGSLGWILGRNFCEEHHPLPTKTMVVNPALKLRFFSFILHKRTGVKTGKWLLDLCLFGFLWVSLGFVFCGVFYFCFCF